MKLRPRSSKTSHPSRPRPRPLPANFEFPCPFRNYRRRTEEWPISFRAQIADISGFNGGNPATFIQIQPSSISLRLSTSWRDKFKGSEYEDWESNSRFEHRGPSSCLLGRGSTNLIILGMINIHKYAVRFPLLKRPHDFGLLNATRVYHFELCKLELYSMKAGDYLKDLFQQEVTGLGDDVVSWLDFSFNSSSAYVASRTINSDSLDPEGFPLNPWAHCLITNYIHLHPDIPELLITGLRPRNDPPVPIYNDPRNSPLPVPNPVTASDVLYFIELHAFTHYCFEKTGMNIIFTHLRGRYSRSRNLLVLSPPVIHAPKATPEALPMFGTTGDWIREEFVRHHSCNWLCALLGLSKLTGAVVGKTSKRLRKRE